jgi:hypothetical protein
MPTDTARYTAADHAAGGSPETSPANASSGQQPRRGGGWHRLAAALATGAIFAFYSEGVFWGATAPERMLQTGTLYLWVAYSVLAYVFLALVTRFRARTVWALFLAGAVFGWLGEGVLVQTTYEMLPLSISFTALAWHALITVLFGWWWVGNALARGDGGAVLKGSGALGVFWGLWSVFWWIEENRVVPLADFAGYALGSTAVLALAYWTLARLRPVDLTPSRSELGLLAMLLALGIGVAVVIVPIAAVILPVLLALAYIGLRRNRSNEEVRPTPEPERRPARPAVFAMLFAAPLTAIGIYAVSVGLDLRLPTNWPVYVVTTAAGFVMFGLSLRRVYRPGPEKGVDLGAVSS